MCQFFIDISLKRFLNKFKKNNLINFFHSFFLYQPIKMYRTYTLCILLAVYTFQPIRTLPQGAPDSVCHSLLPFHGGGIPPSSSRPPYRIVPHNVAVNQGQILRVEIEPQIPELSFGGFMIHARNINPPYQVVSMKKIEKKTKLRNFFFKFIQFSMENKYSLENKWNPMENEY